jgi:hypothetical protein
VGLYFGVRLAKSTDRAGILSLTLNILPHPVRKDER